MNTTLRHIVDDIAKDLKKTDDDKTVQKTQIAYWTLIIADRLKSQHIAKRDSGLYLSTFILDIEILSKVNKPNEIPGRKNIELPKAIYDYDKDKGIDYISYFIEEEAESCPPPFTVQTFTRTTAKDSKRLYYTKYETPSPENPYFYVQGDRVYFLGIECVPAKSVEIGLYTSFDPVTEIDMDETLAFPPETLIILKRQVLDLGRFVLMMPQERINDGDDTIKPQSIPTTKLVSVNELNQETPNNK